MSSIWFILVLVVVIVLLTRIILKFDKKNVLWNIRRWCVISNAKKERAAKQIIVYILSIVLVALIVFLLSTILVKNGNLAALLNISYTSSESIPVQEATISTPASSEPTPIQVTTISTTVFATLTTVLLALVALAVTAYVFLNDALSNRAKYEKNVIITLKTRTRRHLFIYCVLSGVCIALCLIVDNLNLSSWSYLSIVGYGVVITSFLGIVLLVLYINTIVNYENHIIEYARSYIRFNQYDLLGMKRKWLKKEDCTHAEDTSVFIKAVGDLEKLINRVLENHESDFRFQFGLPSNIVLLTVLSKKIKNPSQIFLDYFKERCDQYRRILEIRNCAWIVQDSGDDVCILKNLLTLVTVIEQELMAFVFNQELFVDLNFHDVDFSKGYFSQSSFKRTALRNSTLSGAILKDCDFSGALLQHVNLENADCSGAVFEGARISFPVINTKTKFEKAVFREAEFTMDRDACLGKVVLPSTEYSYPFNFADISAEKVNFIGMQLGGIDFFRAVLTSAQLDDTRLACRFDWADLSNALMTNAAILCGCSFQYANCSGITAMYSKWNAEPESEKEKYIDLQNSRFVHANLANSKIMLCDFSKSYMNDATFVGALINKCTFQGVFLANADFSDTTVKRCDFSETNLLNTLWIGHKGISEGNNTSVVERVCFEKAEMNRCSIRNYIFRNCHFNCAILDNAVIRDTQFIECTFDHTHFNNALLFNVTWKNCSGKIETREEDLDFGTFEDRKQWIEAFLSN